MQYVVPFLTPKVVSGGLQASLTRPDARHCENNLQGCDCDAGSLPQCPLPALLLAHLRDGLVVQPPLVVGLRRPCSAASQHAHTQPAASEKTGQAPKYRLIPRNISFFFFFFFFLFFPVPRSSCFGHHVCHQLTCNGLNAGGGWRPTAQCLNVTTQVEGGLSTNTNQSTKLYLDKYKYKGISIRRI